MDARAGDGYRCDRDGGEDDFSERTIARNVYARLLLARNPKKFNATKVLKRRSINSISDSEQAARPYVHRAALSTSTFMARYPGEID